MEISSSIKYVGVDDLDIDLFESQYVVPEGMAYNSYIILDEKVAIMDTADARKGVEWWANVENVLAGRTPDYLVVQHVEPDHASLISEVLDKFPQLKVVATAKAVQMMQQSGLQARMEKRQEGEDLILTVYVPAAVISTAFARCAS